MATQPCDLGVLLVHGIGMQLHGDTLERFGGSLERWMRERARTHPELAAPTVRIVDTTDRGERSNLEEPLKAILEAEIPDRDPARILLAESWWAEEFRTPKFGELFRWSIGIVPLTIATHSATRMEHALDRLGKAKDWPDTIFAFIRILLLEPLAFLVSTLLTPLVLLLLALLVFLGLIPIPGVRAFVVRAQSVLSGSVGDSFVLVDHPIQHAAILGRLRRDFEWLADRSRKTAIVAHSQGAAIACETVSAFDSVGPDLLLTFGSGLNKLTRIAAMAYSGRRLAPWLACVGLLAVVVPVWLLLTRAGQGGLALGMGLVATLISSLVALIAFRLDWNRTLQDTPDRIQRSAESVGNALWVTFTGLAFLSLAVVLRSEADFPLPMLGLALAGIGVFLVGVRRSITAPFHDGLGDLASKTEWVDVFTRYDPVPNGPPRQGQPTEVVEIANRGLMLTDHNTYWDNPDSFVSLVVSKLAGLAGLGWMGVGGDRATRTRKRRMWRVGWLRGARRMTTAAVAAVLPVRWESLPDFLGRLPAGMGERLGVALERVVAWFKGLPGLSDLEIVQRVPLPGDQAAGVAAVILLGALLYAILAVAWSGWNSHEIRLFFNEEPTPAFGWRFALFLLLCLLTIGATVLVLLERFESAAWIAMLALAAVLLTGWGLAAEKSTSWRMWSASSD